MLKSNIINAIRNLVKHKGFTFIHIGGLAIGLTAGILVLNYARLEYSYDLFHTKADRTFRITTTRLREGVPTTQFASTYAAAAPAILSEYQEVESATRLFQRYRGGVITYEDKHFREAKIFHPDSGLFEVFDFPILSGVKSDLFKPGSAFVEEQVAKKYFGNEDPIGKRIQFGSFDGIEEYEIRGVVRCPENSSITFTFLLSYHDLGRVFGTQHEYNWSFLDFHTFIVLKQGVNPNDFESSLSDLLRRNLGDRATTIALTLQSLPSIYLQSHAQFETGKTGSESVVKLLLVLGVIILIIVCLNYINLSTSHSLTRAREVGVRKALGSSRSNLIFQFLVETALVNLIAFAICCLLMVALLPYFNQLVQRQISLESFMSSDLLLSLFLLYAGTTILIGLYPAVVLSTFRAVDVLKGFFVPKGKGALMREGFVGFQALVSFSLVVAILVILDQVDYVNQKELGIEIDNTLVIKTPDVQTDGYAASLNTFKSMMQQKTGIVNVATTVDSPGEPVSWMGSSRKVGASVEDSHTFFLSVIDEDFFNTMGGRLIAGRMFSDHQSNREVLINRRVAAAYQFASADDCVGQRILVGRDTFEIIGVVDDFHQTSPRDAIMPTIYNYKLEPPRLFLIKFQESARTDVLDAAKEAFGELYPGVPFDYYFLNDFYDRQYDSERRLSTTVGVFCLVAVVVSALGLLGLTWFRLARQKKELAIRKIIGSSEIQLFVNASRRLLTTTLVGCLAGAPIVWYLMTNWLESFAYHTTPKVWELLVALVCSFMIALFSISGHTWKVIRINPVNHLRQE